MTHRTNWLQLVLHAESESEYAGVHQHRVDWLGRLTSFISMMVVGFVVVASGIGIATARPSVEAATIELRERVRAAQESAVRTETEYAQARAALRATQAAVRPDLTGEIRVELDRQSVAAAYVGMRGPGLVLTIDNSTTPLFSGTTDLGQVIDRDLQQVVNGLWRAGAEAISINNIRLTARTSIRNAGATILVDYRPVSAPFRIRAIGDSVRLTNKFKSTPEWKELQQLRDRYGIRWEVSAQSKLRVPAGASTLPRVAIAGGVE